MKSVPITRPGTAQGKQHPSGEDEGKAGMEARVTLKDKAQSQGLNQVSGGGDFSWP